MLGATAKAISQARIVRAWAPQANGKPIQTADNYRRLYRHRTKLLNIGNLTVAYQLLAKHVDKEQKAEQRAVKRADFQQRL